MKHLILTIVALLTCCAGPSTLFAQQPKTISPLDADPRFEALHREGFEALYNLDYAEARRRFEEIARLFPNHPAGPQLLAVGLWLKTMNESRRLQSTLYNSEGFYAKTEEKPDPATVAQFRQWTRQAKQLAEARLKQNPKDVEALYYLGGTAGLKAAFEGAIERSFISALRDGSSAVDRHREVIKLDPSYHDAELSIGLYDYIVGSLPLPFKLLASLTGAHGSKRRGIETLQRVAKEGKWAQDDARVMLIALLKREKRFDEALAISRELSAKYPRNYLFKLELADALVSQAAVARAANHTAEAGAANRDAFALFEELIRDRSVHALDLVHFRYGEALLTAGQPERAAREFLTSANVANAEAGLATMAHLRSGQALDLSGKREQALAEYRVVLTRPNVYDSHDEAKQGLKEPYRPRNSAKVASE